MAVGFSNTNKPLNPRGQDASPKGYNRAKLYSGKALDFDGVNDKVTTTYTSGFTGAQEFTYCAYVYIDSVSGNRAIVHANENTGYGLQSLQLRDGVFRFYAGTGSSDTSLVDSELVEINKWYFVVGTHTATENKIYLNGVLNGTATSASLTIAPDAIVVGAYPSDVLNFNGQISNAKIFNTALTAAQVADLYNNPEKIVPTGLESNLKLWLPMMEGAGTTAYDGSGNGNHGTISGATYVNGIGAPVAQSAVMDWNKGQNVINKSESFLTTYYSNQNITVTADQITAPDGDNNGYKFVASNANTFHLCNHSATVSAGVYTQSIFAKAGEYEHIYLVLRTDNGAKRYGVKFDLSDGTFVDDISYGSPTNTSYAISDAGNGWYRCSVTSTHTSGSIIAVSGPSDGGSLADINNVFQGDGTSGIYAWGLQAEIATSVGAYIPNPSDTRITSDVLLPQGLTTGRDITGVNLFENVRKQGALNLDGNSWAEVHDNESLDLTTAVTLEAWVYWTGSNSTKGILGRWFSGVASYMLYASTSTQLLFFINTSNSPVNISGTGWKHIVGTYDSTNRRVYIDGQEIGSGTGYTTPIAVGDKPIEIGRYAGNTAYQYDGAIAQPRIYNRALTASEVLRNYNSGKNTYTND
jgi:hypothetical protein